MENEFIKDDKIKNFNNFYASFFKFKFYQKNIDVFNCMAKLDNLRIIDKGPTFIDFLFNYSYEVEKNLSCWDTKFSSTKVGLGKAHEFAFPKISKENIFFNITQT